MKKLFRFKYEPCNGTCYAHQPIFFSEMKKLTAERKNHLVDKIVQAHDNLCDNPQYYFGLDLCEDSGLFIGHFVQPERTDIFTGKTLEDCVLKMTEQVISEDIPSLIGNCTYGDSGHENLAEQILQASA